MQKPKSEFRAWVTDLYYDNCDEREMHGESRFGSPEEYFQKYKYWLKREYRYQKNQNKS